MKKNQKFIIIQLLLLTGLSPVKAQTRTAISADLGIESYDDITAYHYGLGYEYQFNNHWGLDAGFSRKNMVLYDYNAELKRLIIPVRVKYYSNIVNVATGPVADFHLGWRNITNSNIPGIVDLSLLDFGLSTSVSKELPIGGNFVFEPSAGFSIWKTGVGGRNLSFDIGCKVKFLPIR